MCVWCPLWPVQRLRSEELSLLKNGDSRQPNPGIQVNDRKEPPFPQAVKKPVYEGSSTSHFSPTTGLPSGELHGGGKPLFHERPIVLFAEGRRGLQVVVCSPEAASWGIRAGMPLGEVQSLLPLTAAITPGRSPSKFSRRNRIQRAESAVPPILKRADPVADRLRLQSLALHCHRYSPLAGLEDRPTPESIWLDISGSEVLFGGERGLAEAVRADLAQQGIQVRVAIADSWGAAWGVSHYGEAGISLVPAGEQAEWLKPLPIAALRIPEPVKQSLQTLDVVTIGQLIRLPRASLPSRFGKELVRRLDQALGVIPELLSAERPVEPLIAEWPFEEPVTDRQVLDHVCEILLERLLKQVEERRAGLQELVCHWLGTTTEPTLLHLLRPTTQKRHLLDLLRLQNEQRIFTSGVHGVRMQVVEIGLPPVRQATLFGEEMDDRHPQALAELVDRLSMRLGRQRVLRPQRVPDPQPEFACKAIPWGTEPASTEGEMTIPVSQLRCRPLRLYLSPRPLLVDGFSDNGLPCRVNRSTVVRATGPERIETGWWRGPDTKRDYYRLDLANGATLWAFVDRDIGLWFLHGLFM